MWGRVASARGSPEVGRAAARARRARAPLLALAAVALIGGLWGALARLALPVAAPETLIASHGLLMTMGFLGTVISLERAVALGRPGAYAAPVLAAAGGVASIVGLPIGLWLFGIAGLAFAATCAYMWRLRTDLAVGTMALGGLAWAGASIGLALGTPAAQAVPLLAAFLVLTVTGERVGLSRLLHPPAWSRLAFVIACAFLAVGAAMALVAPLPAATRLAGAGLVALAGWLGLWDFAWRSVRRSGVTRYMAVALIAGYFWLAAGGIVWLLYPTSPTIFAYDALIHTVFVGFVLSMIFAHELMIVPAILGIDLPFTRAFYVPLVLLHLSLAARIGGDIARDATTWQRAATTNVIAVLLFAALSVVAATRGGARHQRTLASA